MIDLYSSTKKNYLAYKGYIYPVREMKHKVFSWHVKLFWQILNNIRILQVYFTKHHKNILLEKQQKTGSKRKLYKDMKSSNGLHLQKIDQG